MRQDVSLPFARCLVGPFDYTPMLFNAGKAGATKLHKLAMFVVSPGATSVMRGSIKNLVEKSPEAVEFLRRLYQHETCFLCPRMVPLLNEELFARGDFAFCFLFSYQYDSILRHYYTGAVLHHDPSVGDRYVENYSAQLARIIEEDSRRSTQTRSKKDDWLGRLFRIRDREEREEIYIEEEQDNEQDWQYEW